MNALITCLLFSFYPAVYPIDPRPLRMLVDESEYIMVGYVEKTVTDSSLTWDNTTATIAVKEVLQGKINSRRIEVSFTPGMVCPSPDMYFDSTLVLAFLDKKNGTYTTHALSYGSKTLKAEEIEIYKLRIRELLKIQRIRNKKEKYRQTVEWLVKCAEQPATRWEGTFELSPESDFMSCYKQSRQPDFVSSLTMEQKVRLKNALFVNRSRNQLCYEDFGLVDLIYAEYTAEIDRLLIENLKNINGDEFWMVDSYMVRLGRKTDDPRAEKIAVEFREKYDYGMNESPENLKLCRALITEFLGLMEGR